MEYSDLLKKARLALPEIVSVRERFEIPKVRGNIQGNKTIVSNFFQISNALSREPPHLLKYLLKELATSGEVKDSLLIFKTKLSANSINQKVRQYANTFVLCVDCGKPDTKIMEEKGILFLKCQACGAKHHIKH
jgi:translation initiation factor 2 subunit 2